jgi:putative transposase
LIQGVAPPLTLPPRGEGGANREGGIPDPPPYYGPYMARCRTFRYLLQPTTCQVVALELLLRRQCELYNAALEDRRGAWRWERRSVSFFDQCRTLTELRSVRPEILDCGVTVCRGTLKRLDRAFCAFYRRVASGQTPGFPRFKSVGRFDSVQWEDTCGWRLDSDSRRLHLCGIGGVKVRLHRPTRGTPKAITVAREGRRWFVSIRCTDVPAEPLPRTGHDVGIDLGVCALVATSDGDLITEGRFGHRAAQKLTETQRPLSTKHRGSNRRKRAVERVASAHRKVRNQRKDLAHKLSRQLVNNYDLIVCEDLRVSNMVRRPKPKPNEEGGFDPNGARAKTGLDRSIHDAGWGVLLSFLVYKAEQAGRELITVHARHTSQMCSRCEHISRDNRVSQAEFRCQACGHEAHADTNAAVNILRAGRAQQALACVGSHDPLPDTTDRYPRPVDPRVVDGRPDLKGC